MAPELRIVIADDHPLIREGLRLIIANVPRFCVVGEMSDGLSALAGIAELRPDVALLDVDMPGQDGFAVARAVKAQGLPTKIVFLTMHKNEALLRAALDLGAAGYLLKDSVLADIITCLDAVRSGQTYFSAGLINLLVKQTSGKPGQTAPWEILSPTERRVLKLIAAHQTSREIGDALHISARTVDRHRANIALKLDLQGAHALLKFALEHQAAL